MLLSATLSRVALYLCAACAVAAQPVPSNLFQALQWRFIGPYRGGRVIAVSGVEGDERTFYFGAVGGGIWKTTDGGTVWTPIFDGQPVASIGAIEVAPSNPNIVYAGSGETDMRSDISFGDGVYKSTDAGKTWKNVGLHDSQQIGRIVIDPRNPEVVYAAALGHAYAPNPERGVYRSTDGGATWSHVLDKGPDIGAIDLAIDPENPRVLYATTWNARRPPWSQYGPIEGPGGGLYKSTDGGDAWSAVTGNGLPSGAWGHAGIAVARGTSGRRVYALIDAKSAPGLYRSDDSGSTWTRVSNDPRITSRGWYFGQIAIDPHDPDIVYLPNVATYRSTDGGKNFEVLKGAPGGDDYHTLWIDPADPTRIILGSDQGVNISIDRGKTSSLWYNQPTAQMYHVVTDNQFPYWVYGSQQDSGTVALPSRTNHGQINEYDRRWVGGAESGYIAPDPKDPNIVYVGDTGGSLARWDKRTAQSQNITPWPLPSFGTDITKRKYRFPWTSPLIFSKAGPPTLYYGSQILLKTTDGGLNWAEISGDLTGAEKSAAIDGPVTTANAKARGYGVIYSIAPSPLNPELIWTGSDSGMIYLTRSGGKTWTSVTPKGLSDWSKIGQLEASHFDPAVAYAAVDRHRLDDYSPHILRTRDYGKTWTEMDTGIAAPAFVNAVREDPARKGLLYAATETGVYVSFDDGGNWQPLQRNLPVVSIRDLVVHGDDLVIATHGRGFYILDDITPLRQANAKLAANDAVLFKPATAIRIVSAGFQGTPFPFETPRAANPPTGAVIDYYLPAAAADEVKLEILDAKGRLVRRYSTNDRPPIRRIAGAIAAAWFPPPERLTAAAGLNRFVWDLRYTPPETIGRRRGGGDEEEGEAAGPMALPGSYQVRLTAAGRSLTQPLIIAMDPRSDATPAALAAQFDLGMKASRGMQRSVALARQTQGGRSRTALADVNRRFAVVLAVVNSADRRPPAQAYAIYDQAIRDLDAGNSQR